MNPPKCNELDYIHFLIAAQKVFTCTEAARCQPEGKSPSHDAFTRLLQRQSPDTEALWQEAKELVNRERGLLLVDDTTLDKVPRRWNWSPTIEAVNTGEWCVASTFKPSFGPMGKLSSPATFGSMPKPKTVTAKATISRQCLRKLRNGTLSQALCCLIVGMPARET